MKLYPLEWYGVRRGNSTGAKYIKGRCAGESNHGFGTVSQCKKPSGHGERGLFCERHQNLQAKPEQDPA